MFSEVEISEMFSSSECSGADPARPGPAAPRSPAEPSYAEQGSCTVTPRPTRWEGPWEPLLTFCPGGPTNHSWKGAHFSHSFFGLYRDHPQLFSKKYGAYLVHSRDFISAQDRPRARNVGAFTDFVQKVKLQKVQGQPRQDSHFPSSGSPTLVTGTSLRPGKQASPGASLRCRPGPPPLDRLSGPAGDPCRSDPGLQCRPPGRAPAPQGHSRAAGDTRVPHLLWAGASGSSQEWKHWVQASVDLLLPADTRGLRSTWLGPLPCRARADAGVPAPPLPSLPTVWLLVLASCVAGAGSS